ncbi:MAG: MerC domain-containing protein [Bacteroidota bacterium]
MIARLFQFKADFAGIFASILCLIHCLLAPIVAISLPYMGQSRFMEHDHFHGSWLGLDSLFVMLSLFAVWFAAKEAHQPVIRWGLWSSWAIFAAGIILHIQGIEAGELLSYVGSFALIISHVFNFRSHLAHH